MKTMIIGNDEQIGDVIVIGRYGGAYTTRYVITDIATEAIEVPRRRWDGEKWVSVTLTKRTATIIKATDARD